MDNTEIESQAEKADAEAYSLAREAAKAAADLQAVQTRATKLMAHVEQLRDQNKPPSQTAQRALGEAMLDLMWISQGARGPSSIRISHYLEDLKDA